MIYMKLNSNYNNLKKNYLFSEIAHRVKKYSSENPDKKIIKMGIGDVTLPLVPAVVDAMKKASEEMGRKETFHGYGDEQGYMFLRKAVSRYYSLNNVNISPDEVFISDGAKSDVGNFLDIFDKDNTVLVQDPVYTVYVDTNIMNGRNIIHYISDINNGFRPLPDEGVKADIIYICSPNNPTGVAMTYDDLKKWVDYAIDTGAVILFDAAYEAFIQDDNVPHSIFEIPGARSCSVEFCSLSKTAGFTGTRCGYTVIPSELDKIHSMWLRRQTTKFNGVSYVVQRGAEAVFSETGLPQVKANIRYYLDNAEYIRTKLSDNGLKVFGGVNSPYVWVNCPDEFTSWQYFDYLLCELNIVATPGSGFGDAGEGFMRFSALGDKNDTIVAMDRLRK